MSVSDTSTSQMPLVTIGIASYNNGHYIVQLLDSIRRQSYARIQLLVVDNCSPDNSVAVIEEWAATTGFPVQLTRQTENSGIVGAVAELRRQAKGEFVLWMGSDDWLLPHMVEDSVAEFARRGPTCGAVYSDCLVVDKDGAEVSPSFLHYFNPRFGPPYPEGNLRVPLLSGLYLPTPACMVRRSALDQIGPYDLSLQSEDLDTWLRLSVQWQFAYLPKVTAAYRVHDRSMTHSNKPRLNETFLRIYQKTDFAPGPELAAANRALTEHAEHYYASQRRAAAPYLWQAYRKTNDVKLLAFYAASLLGISHQQLLSVLQRGRQK